MRSQQLCGSSAAWPCALEGCHFTLIAANPWERMVPQLGVMVNSFGFIVGISSLFQEGPWLPEKSRQLETPSPGIRSLKVMGTKEVLLREHIKV